MKKIIKHEHLQFIYSYSLAFSIPICIIAACITNFVIAGAPQSAYVYGVAFEHYIPQMILVTVPTTYIAAGLHKEQTNAELPYSEKRYAVFIAKSVIYYVAQFIVINIYLLVLTLFNINGITQQINGEMAILYFLRSTSIGIAYCFMLSTILFLVSISFRNTVTTIIADIALTIVGMILKSTVNWRVANKVIPCLMMEQLIDKTNNNQIIIRFSLSVIIISIMLYISALLIYCNRDNK